MTSPTQAATEPEPAPEDATATEGPKAAPELVGRSPRQLAWARFKRDRTGIICAFIVGAFSIQPAPRALTTTLPPDSFSGMTGSARRKATFFT